MGQKVSQNGPFDSSSKIIDQLKVKELFETGIFFCNTHSNEVSVYLWGGGLKVSYKHH